MASKIKIKFGSVEISAVLNDSETAKAIERALPIVGRAQTWGEEIYFFIPVEMPLEKDAKEVVNLGDLGYWPKGKAFCMFFGPTPISKGNEIIPASAVNIVGQMEGNLSVLKSVKDGETVVIEKIG